MAVHISNQYLDLAPVIARLADRFAENAVLVHSEKDGARALSEAFWMLVTRNREFLSRAEVASSSAAVAHLAAREWTDDYNNLFEAMRWIPPR
jgi:hypothetical protein